MSQHVNANMVHVDANHMLLYCSSAFRALCSGWFSDKFGRRSAFRIAAIAFIFGTLVQSGASGFSGLMFGRTFVGLGVGFGLAVDPVYIGEISQAAHRGQLVTWSEIAVS